MPHAPLTVDARVVELFHAVLAGLRQPKVPPSSPWQHCALASPPRPIAVHARAGLLDAQASSLSGPNRVCRLVGVQGVSRLHAGAGRT